MDEIDLEIENYTLGDILKLFNLAEDFGEFELKNAKKMVLMTHPDKSKLDKEVFIFFAKAYKYLRFLFDFRHRSDNTMREDLAGSEQDAEFIAKIKEKKTPNFAISFRRKILPNKSINPILIIKNSITTPIKLKVSKTEVSGISFRIISEILIDINKKVMKLTLSVKAFSSLKYWLA